jgi:tetratricopeptide (TPR) repeat protein
VLPSAHQEEVRTAQATRGRRRRTGRSIPSGWVAPAIGYGFLLALLVGTLTFDFMNFTPMPGEMDSITSINDLPSAGTIFYRALFVHPQQDFATRPFLIGLIVLSWLFGMILIVSESIKDNELKATFGEMGRTALSAGLVIGTIALVIGMIYGLIQAGLIRQSFIAPAGLETMTEVERRVEEALRIGRYLSTYYAFALTMIAGAGIALASGRASKERQWASIPGWVSLAVLSIFAIVLINVTNLNVIQADMVYKRGKPFDSQAGRLEDPAQQVIAWDNAIGIYEQAIDMAPSEDFYYLWLGRALLEKSSAVTAAQRTALLNVARDELLSAQDANPLNTDHTANLARLNVRWASVTEGDERQARVDDAERFYRDALELSPQNSVIRNELATMYLGLSNDCAQAIETMLESAEIDPFYLSTSVSLSDTYRRCSAELEDDERKIYLEEAEAWADVGLTQPPERQYGTNRTARQLEDVTTLYLRLANTYSEYGQLDQARRVAEKALEIAPETQLSSIQDFITQLDAQEAE